MERLTSESKNLNEFPRELNFEISHVQILVLFGSRARGDYDEHSDWDFAVLCDRDRSHDVLTIYRTLSETYGIPEDRIDVVDLDRTSELIAHHVARDGQLIYERNAETFANFQRRSLLNDEQLHQHRQKSRQTIEQFLLSKGV